MLLTYRSHRRVRKAWSLVNSTCLTWTSVHGCVILVRSLGADPIYVLMKSLI